MSNITNVTKKYGPSVLTGGLIDPTLGTVSAGREATRPTDISQPALTPPTPMPIPGQDSLANIMARRASIAAQLARRGRLSTILSQIQPEPLGS